MVLNTVGIAQDVVHRLKAQISTSDNRFRIDCHNCLRILVLSLRNLRYLAQFDIAGGPGLQDFIVRISRILADCNSPELAARANAVAGLKCP